MGRSRSGVCWYRIPAGGAGRVPAALWGGALRYRRGRGGLGAARHGGLQHPGQRRFSTLGSGPEQRRARRPRARCPRTLRPPPLSPGVAAGHCGKSPPPPQAGRGQAGLQGQQAALEVPAAAAGAGGDVGLHWVKRRMEKTAAQAGHLQLPGTVRGQVEPETVKAGTPGAGTAEDMRGADRQRSRV